MEKIAELFILMILVWNVKVQVMITMSGLCKMVLIVMGIPFHFVKMSGSGGQVMSVFAKGGGGG